MGISYERPLHMGLLAPHAAAGARSRNCLPLWYNCSGRVWLLMYSLGGWVGCASFGDCSRRGWGGQSSIVGRLCTGVGWGGQKCPHKPTWTMHRAPRCARRQTCHLPVYDTSCSGRVHLTPRTSSLFLPKHNNWPSVCDAMARTICLCQIYALRTVSQPTRRLCSPA